MPFFAHAVTPPLTYTPLATIPKVTDTAQPSSDFIAYLKGVFNLAIMGSGVLAVLMIVYGGFIYATTDAFQKKEEGRGYMTNALYGLAVVYSSYLFLRTLNPDLVNLDIIIGQQSLPSQSVASQFTSPEDAQIKISDAGIANQIRLQETAGKEIDSLQQNKDALTAQIEELQTKRDQPVLNGAPVNKDEIDAQIASLQKSADVITANKTVAVNAYDAALTKQYILENKKELTGNLRSISAEKQDVSMLTYEQALEQRQALDELYVNQNRKADDLGDTSGDWPVLKGEDYTTKIQVIKNQSAVAIGKKSLAKDGTIIDQPNGRYLQLTNRLKATEPK